MTRVTIVTTGSRGDVYPYLALGYGLKAAGHEVSVATLRPFEEDVRRQGLDFRALDDPLADVKGSPEWLGWQSAGLPIWRKVHGLRSLLHRVQPALLHHFDQTLEACREADLIISSVTGFAGPHIAELLGCLHVWALLQPSTPTLCFPHFLSPWPGVRNGAVNKASYRIANAGFRLLFERAFDSWRRRLGLPGVALSFPGGSGGHILYGWSEAVLPRPTDWPLRTVHVTGYWRMLRREAAWAVPETLSSFLEHSPQPICVCHGSVTGWRHVPRSLETVCEAVRAAGSRAVILTPGTGMEGTRLGAECLAFDFIPLDWLLPRVALVVHHTGAGTVAAAAHAACPSITLPSCFDQRFWAEALWRVGAAPRPLRPDQVTSAKLAAAIREVLRTPQYSEAARSCAARLREEDGVQKAVEVLSVNAEHARREVRWPGSSASTS